MENATKALLIAAGVLVAILILTIGVTLYAMFSGQARSYNILVSEIEVEKFNSNFNVFLGQSNIKPEDVISVVNKAKEYNNMVNVLVCKKDTFTIIDTSNSEQFMEKYLNITFRNEDLSTQYDENGKITKIKFIANN